MLLLLVSRIRLKVRMVGAALVMILLFAMTIIFTQVNDTDLCKLISAIRCEKMMNISIKNYYIRKFSDCKICNVKSLLSGQTDFFVITLVTVVVMNGELIFVSHMQL